MDKKAKPVKKVIILDAGGVLHPDAEFGAPNQEALSKLTKLSQDQLNEYQEYPTLNLGKRSLREALVKVRENIPGTEKPSVDELLQTYKNGITLYPGAADWIRELYKAGYQVILCTNNSHEGVAHTRELLANEDLSCVRVYGSAELGMSKPNPKIFEYICKAEKVSPEECWFVDDREKNLEVAKSLGISPIKFNRPATLSDAAKEVNACRNKFIELEILNNTELKWPTDVKKGKYPSLLGVSNDNKVVRYLPSEKSYVVVDTPNEDGNQKKRCEYESRLAQLIVEQSQHWIPAYHKINQLFLADFDLKSDPTRVQDYKAYFDKIESTLKKERLIEDKPSYDVQELRAALVKLFEKDFNLTNISQFYYNVWLFDYGHEVLEPFVFLTDQLKKNQSFPSDPSSQDDLIRILKLFPDLAQNPDARRQAYIIAQPWLTCGSPHQLRGRQLRADAPKPANAKTFGIVKDDATNAAAFSSPLHFAAKILFAPMRKHPIAKAFQAEAAPMVGGSSGTLGRNILMLAPLVQSGLLTQAELMRYVMGFLADLIYRGHHSYEEVAAVAEQILFPLKPWFDPLRDPLRFYEQLLTKEFLDSDEYKAFLKANKNFFEAPAGSDPEIKPSIDNDIEPIDLSQKNIDTLLKKIDELMDYGKFLEMHGQPHKGSKAVILAQNIRVEVTAFFEKDSDKAIISSNLSKLITAGKKAMGEDRKLKDILAHILLALTGIGLFIILGNKFLSKSKSGFLNDTKRQKIFGGIDKEVQQLTKRNSL